MLKIYSKSDIGLIRQTNQDACKSGIFPDGAAWAVVCDGMGGVNGGNIASSIAVDCISDQMQSSYTPGMSDNAIKDLITTAIYNANLTIHEKAKGDAELNGMGTTVVAAILSNGLAHIAHAGDSRAYLLGKDGIKQLTVDHSMVQEMVNNGDLTEQQAKIHPQKNIITRALGVEPSILIDYCEKEFLAGDLLLICTDGLTNYVDAEQIYQLSGTMNAESLTEKLVMLAKDCGGGDNITVVIIEN
ncbi:Stp1/IreP family PP2C-type Ser/Thr phosphatase [Caproiciproducens galactitolivorans]|uniref:Serine/threonine phosphatase stp n=1 Tax=Caproiciproducens galactitolivorans TaxID=642589 RepID=A0A4Z0YBD7_9FIRM|nr:Stp1/IreP family PP2C-type Ser/Thr phosphatase [Caproiciproducens galactitolivorans]TGJ76551.1 serine/threonine phosphatase stp [Caproiciproducens galactitolivorans]